jgi:transcriptional regulator with XRE-family HTH domain
LDLLEQTGGTQMPKDDSGALIGQRIRQARERLGYNQAKLAQEAEITPAAISQIEGGDRTPSTPILRKLASVLRVSTDFLLGTTNDIELKDILQDDKVQKFFRGFQNLSPNDQEFIQKQVDLLKAPKRK